MNVEEDRLCQQLRYICDSHGREPNDLLEETAEILYQLGKVYRQKSPDKISLIQSAGLFNAALARKKKINKQSLHIKESLQELCSHVLQLACAEKQDADLVAYSEIVKMSFKRMRINVTERLKDVTQIHNDTDNSMLLKKEKNKATDMKKLQETLTKDFKQIVNDMCKYCDEVLREPPEKYALVGLGSLARKEITPYSDFEHIILLKEGSPDRADYENVVEYFRWFAVMFQIVIVNLQETVIRRLAVPCLNDETRKDKDWLKDIHTTCGISLDSMLPHACKNPLGRRPTPNKQFSTELIKPVSEMLEYLGTEENLKNGYNLSDILMDSCFVFGDYEILEQFQEGVRNFRLNNQSIVRDYKLKLLKEDLISFGVRLQLDVDWKKKFVFEVKPLIYRVTTLFISTLGSLQNISASSCFDIIEELQLSDYAKRKLQYAVAIACEVRLKHYMEYENQLAPLNASDLINYVGEKSIVNYFQIAYALQCEICKLNNITDHNFYPVSFLLNISLCYFLNRKQHLSKMITKFDKMSDLELKYAELDHSIMLLEAEINESEKIDAMQTEQNSRKTSVNCDENEIKSLVLKYREFFYYSGMWETCIEYCQYRRFITTPDVSNMDTLDETGYTQQIIGLSFMKGKKYNEALNSFLLSLNMYQQIINNCRIFSSTYEMIGSFLMNDCTNDLTRVKNCGLKKIISFTLNMVGSYLVNESLSIKEIRYKFTKRNIVVANFSLAECLFWIKDYQKSMKTFKLTICLYEAYSKENKCDEKFEGILPSCFAFMGNIHILCESHSQALECFWRFIKLLSPISEKIVDFAEEIILNYGMLLFERKEYEISLKYFSLFLDSQKLIQSSPKLVLGTHINAAKCMIEIGKTNEALQYLLETLPELEKTLPRLDSDELAVLIYIELGVCYFKLKDFKNALFFFRKGVQILLSMQKQSPQNKLRQANNFAAARHNMGVIFLKQNKKDEALHCFNDARKSILLAENANYVTAIKRKKPTVPSITSYCVNIFALRTERLYNQLAKNDTQNFLSNTFKYSGEAYCDFDDYGNGFICYKKALAMRPPPITKEDKEWYVDVYYNAGLCKCSLKQYDRALVILEKALEHHKGCNATGVPLNEQDIFRYAQLFLSIAECLIDAKRFEDVLKALNKSSQYFAKISPTEKLKLQRNVSDVFHSLSVAKQEICSFSIALVYSEMALSIRPPVSNKDDEGWLANCWYDAARCLFEMKAYNQALIYLKKSSHHGKIYEEISGVKNHSRCSYLFCRISDCMIQLKQPDDALKALKKSWQHFNMIPTPQMIEFMDLQETIKSRFNFITKTLKKATGSYRVVFA